jgi:hypothetical protein
MQYGLLPSAPPLVASLINTPIHGGVGRLRVREKPFSTVSRLAQYIAQPEEHHPKRSFSEEARRLVERYGLEWHKEDETVENGFIQSATAPAPR